MTRVLETIAIRLGQAIFGGFLIAGIALPVAFLLRPVFRALGRYYGLEWLD